MKPTPKRRVDRSGIEIIRLCGDAIQRGGRILVIGPENAHVACEIAHALPECGVVILGTPASRGPAVDVIERPANLHVLACTIDGAHFLPCSIASVVASRHAILAPTNDIATIAAWLVSRGALIILDNDAHWRFWCRAVRLAMWTALRHAGDGALRLEHWREPGVIVFRKR